MWFKLFKAFKEEKTKVVKCWLTGRVFEISSAAISVHGLWESGHKQ